MDSTFDFKFVSKSELESVVKRVRRQKQKQHDIEKWNAYVKKMQEKSKIEKDLERANNNMQVTNSSMECYLTAAPRIVCVPRHEEETLGQNLIVDTVEEISSRNYRSNAIDTNLCHHYQLGPVLTKRLQDLLSTVSKMTTVLLSPCLRAPDEDEDVERTIKRSLEFDSMFARNHLYEIQRLMKDTKQTASGKYSSAELENKISAILKCVTQALQVYTKHVSKGSRVKYQQVVPIFQTISTVQSLLENISGQRLFPMRQELEVSCSYLKQILLEVSATETRSVATVSMKASKVRPKHKASADLSMYKDWRRKSSKLASLKFGPPRKMKGYNKTKIVKESGLDTNLITEPGAVSNLGAGNKVSTDPQSKDVSNTKALTFRHSTRAIPEEQVTTMMDVISHEEQLVRPKLKSEGDTKSGREGERNHEETCNVKLVCVKELPPDDKKPTSGSVNTEPIMRTLHMQESEKTESLEYQRTMIEYQRSNPLYKDNKAVAIVDRLANRILKEMLIDFQQSEIDEVIRTLYNLEFE